MLRRVIARSFSLPILASSAVHATDMRDDRQVCPRGTPHPLHDDGAGKVSLLRHGEYPSTLEPFWVFGPLSSGSFFVCRQSIAQVSSIAALPMLWLPFSLP